MLIFCVVVAVFKMSDENSFHNTVNEYSPIYIPPYIAYILVFTGVGYWLIQLPVLYLALDEMK
jgi:hypothetical protein